MNEPGKAPMPGPPGGPPPGAGGGKPPLPGPPGKPPAKTVKQETLFFTAFACLVIGFLAGIVFSVYKMPGAAMMAGGEGASQGAAGPGQMSPEQARVLLSLEREVAANPENVQAWTQLGHIYFDTDQPQKAIEAYDKSLALAPDNPDVITDQGVMYRRIGDAAKAVASFERAIALNPRHETARFNKGIVLIYDLHDKEGGLKAWEDLLEINPGAYAPNGQLLREILAEIRKTP